MRSGSYSGCRVLRWALQGSRGEFSLGHAGAWEHMVAGMGAIPQQRAGRRPGRPTGDTLPHGHIAEPPCAWHSSGWTPTRCRRGCSVGPQGSREAFALWPDLWRRGVCAAGGQLAAAPTAAHRW